MVNSDLSINALKMVVDNRLFDISGRIEEFYKNSGCEEDECSGGFLAFFWKQRILEDMADRTVDIKKMKKILLKQTFNKKNNQIELCYLHIVTDLMFAHYALDEEDWLGCMKHLHAASRDTGILISLQSEKVFSILDSDKKSSNAKRQHQIKKQADEPIRLKAIETYVNRPKGQTRNNFALRFCWEHNKNIINEDELLKESTVKQWIKDYLKNANKSE
ncbi:hypothetical protein [Acinetobacter sp. MD2(2019)]|uniref:hypothetical protein n=1 Tax=Acinetobacter sp. MD2(2019) TaxID=2605273 RepID=UPI002D1EC3C1|nr:hypothetical protein [Acinetobacter sp. MD2(2019)]MEB3754308.1 hypothetical protein [Acinetobacter sp. MD2(2019)]